jgi:hypothetical protein
MLAIFFIIPRELPISWAGHFEASGQRRILEEDYKY